MRQLPVLRQEEVRLPVLRQLEVHPEAFPQQAVFPQPAVRQRAESCLQREAFPDHRAADQYAATGFLPAVRRAEVSSWHLQRAAARPEPASSVAWGSVSSLALDPSCRCRAAGHQPDPFARQAESMVGEPLSELQSAEVAAACARPEAVHPPEAVCESAQPRAAPSAWQAEVQAAGAVQPWARPEVVAAAGEPASGAAAEAGLPSAEAGEAAVPPSGEAAAAEPQAAAEEQQQEAAAVRPAWAAEQRRAAVRGRDGHRAAVPSCPCPWLPALARRRSGGLAPVTAR